MYTHRMLRITATAAIKLRAISLNAPISNQLRQGPIRYVCANSTSPRKPQSTAVGLEKPVEPTVRPDAGKVVESSSIPKATPVEAVKLPTSPTTGGTSAAQTNAQFPDVPSTSLGFEDPHTNDPLKWKKFAFKYAGALLVFLISYKTLHWYVDRLEADGKRRRAEVEENKEIIREIDAPRGSEALVASAAVPLGSTAMAPIEGSVNSSAMVQAGGKNEGRSVRADEEVPQMRIFNPVKEEEAHMVSELEELYVYRVELESKLRDLREGKSSKEGDALQRNLKVELNELEDEIRTMEAEEARNKV